MLVVKGFLSDSLVSVMHVKSNLVLSRAGKLTRSFIWQESEEIFKWSKEKSCCFILIF